MTITTRRQDYPQSNFSQVSRSRTSLATTSILGGAVLAAYGIPKRNWVGTALAAGGAYLIYSGVAEATKPYSGKVRVSFTIDKSPDEVFSFVRSPERWAQFMHGLVMEPIGNESLRLTFGEAAGFKVVSEAKITDEEPGRFVAWASGAGPLQHRGVLHLRPAPGERGTEISVALEFKAPAGPVARAVAQFVGWDPEQLVRESLRHLKQLIEAGEIPTTRGQSVGSRGLKGAALRVLYREGSTEDAVAPRLAGD